MSDVTNFQIGDEIINIKDEQARSDAAEAKEIASNALNGRLLADFKNVIFFGDSYTQGYTPSGDVSSWAQSLRELLPAENTAVIAAGGLGFAHSSGSVGKTAIQYWDAQKSNVSWRADATAFLVMLGVNDNDQEGADIYNAAVTFFNRIKTDCPKATIFYMFNPSYTTYRNPVEYCTRAALDSGAVNLGSEFWELLEDDYFSSDWLHPNATGQNDIARKVLIALQGGKVRHYKYFNIAAESGWSANIGIYDDIVRFYCSGTVPASRSDTICRLEQKWFRQSRPAVERNIATGLEGSGTNIDGQVCVSFGGSTYSISVYAIHIGDDLSTGNVHFCETMSVLEFFGE